MMVYVLMLESDDGLIVNNLRRFRFLHIYPNIDLFHVYIRAFSYGSGFLLLLVAGCCYRFWNHGHGHWHYVDNAYPILAQIYQVVFWAVSLEQETVNPPYTGDTYDFILSKRNDDVYCDETECMSNANEYEFFYFFPFYFPFAKYLVRIYLAICAMLIIYEIWLLCRNIRTLMFGNNKTCTNRKETNTRRAFWQGFATCLRFYWENANDNNSPSFPFSIVAAAAFAIHASHSLFQAKSNFM